MDEKNRSEIAYLVLSLTARGHAVGKVGLSLALLGLETLPLVPLVARRGSVKGSIDVGGVNTPLAEPMTDGPNPLG